MTVREKLKQKIQDFDILFGGLRKKVYTLAAEIHKLGTRFGYETITRKSGQQVKVPATPFYDAFWNKWFSLKRDYNLLQRTDRTDKAKAEEQAQRKGAFTAHRQVFSGYDRQFGGLDPLRGFSRWSPESSGFLTWPHVTYSMGWETQQMGAVAIATAAAIALAAIPVAMAVSWLATKGSELAKVRRQSESVDQMLDLITKLNRGDVDEAAAAEMWRSATGEPPPFSARDRARSPALRKITRVGKGIGVGLLVAVGGLAALYVIGKRRKRRAA